MKKTWQKEEFKEKVLDVRRVMEWQAGHIEQATHRPLDAMRLRPATEPQEMDAQILAGLDPAKLVLVHCKSGYRSSIATSLLQRAGFANVMNVVGGFDAWAAQPFPVVAPDQPACATAPK